jgi:protein SCO1/2
MTRRRGIALLGSCLLLVAGCGEHKKVEVPIQQYQLRGQVVRVEAARDIAVIKHEKIDGWMEAMTMEFPVRDKSELAKLAPGQNILATVYVQDLDYWIGGIQVQ